MTAFENRGKENMDNESCKESREIEKKEKKRISKVILATKERRWNVSTKIALLDVTCVIGNDTRRQEEMREAIKHESISLSLSLSLSFWKEGSVWKRLIFHWKRKVKEKYFLPLLRIGPKTLLSSKVEQFHLEFFSWN
jgi:predicted Ser/Thr protein kinase